ncbi:cyclophilin-like fold protein [Xylophilus sp. Leaf220]|uniref:cyclophilin-like fold protein n=1 Tax=Xylophilus sp. Leaf220 TaxID=1735686 RepID=UPI0009EBEAB8|nr:cyclophilin-like fold protein [Xylophilus sp. Leaf220]
MMVRIAVDGVVIATGLLDDNASARNFAALLPLDLLLNDYEATEKIAHLPRRLSTVGAPTSWTPSAGDIAYYAPWGNLAIFYAPGPLSEGLVRLGRLHVGTEALRRVGPVAVRIVFE